MNQLIYIDGQLLDLYKEGSKKFIAVTVEGFNIGNLTVRDVTKTNRITVPPTNNNKTLLGLNDEHSEEITPYRKKKATVVQNGVETISGGVAVVLGFNGIDYEISILSGVYDLFSSIEDLNVDDVDFGVYEVIDDAYLDSIRESTDLFSAPVIDLGSFFPSKQTLRNTTFSESLSPWQNITNASFPNGIDWIFDGSSGALSDHSTNAGAPYGGSNTISQKYKLFKDFKYRITLTAEFDQQGYTVVPANNIFLLFAVLGFVDDNNPSENPETIYDSGSLFYASSSTSQTYSVDIEYTMTSDINYIGVFANHYLNATGGGNFSKFRVTSLTVQDISGSINVKKDFYIPLISYSKTIEKIVTNAGFTLSLNMSDSDYYEKLFIVYSKQNYEYPKKLIAKLGFNYSAPGTQSLTLNSTTKQNIQFTNKSVLGDYNWYNGIDTYSPQNLGYSVELVVTATIIVTATISGSDTIGLFFRLDGSTQTQTETITTSGLHVYTFESNVIDAGLSTFTFDVSANRASGSGSNTLVISAGIFSSDVRLKAYNTINLSALVLPTISQKDFLADFFYRFGILAEEKNNIVTFSEVEKIYRDRNIKDWTYKRDRNISKKISYELDGYAQENVFTDIESDDYIVNNSNASMLIDNDILKLVQEYYKSVMSTIEQNFNNSMQLCRINVFDRTQDDNIGTFDNNPRLVYLRTERDGDAVIKFNDVTKTSYLVAVYNDPLCPFNSTWKYFLETYYPNITSSLQRSKITTDYFNLDEVDVSSISISDLIFDNGVYYLLVKIYDFIPNQKTKVDLFKLS